MRFYPTLPLPDRFWKKVDKRGPDECWPWIAARFENGYGAIRVGKKHRKAHVVSLEMALGRPLAPGMHALHTCDHPWCVNPAHLWEGTMLDNHRDREAKGRGRRTHGSESTSAVLSENDVHAIRRAWATGEVTQRDLADAFGVEQTTIGYIVRYEKWAHLVTEGAPPSRTRRRLAPDQIEEIRRIGHSQPLRVTAALYGVHNSIVSRIVNGQVHRSS